MLNCKINTSIWSYHNKLIASGGDDGQIYLCASDSGMVIQQMPAYLTKTNEFLAGGLGDGYLKVWDLKKKDARTFKPTNYLPRQSVTSTCYNSNFNFIGASNNQGYINIFPNNKNQVPNSQPQEEVIFFKNSDAPINQFKFSPLLDSVIASAQEDNVVALYDMSSNKNTPTATFTNHKAGVRGIGFSPLNKLLLCSVSLDKSINFYDINKHKKVSGLIAPEPLQSISFNCDGHTVAVGANNSGTVFVYDLRNQSQIMMTLLGHQSTVNSINFKHSESNSKTSSRSQPQSSTNVNQAAGQISSSVKNTSSGLSSPNNASINNIQPQQIQGTSTAATQFKTMEQIREEAKRNVEMRKKNEQMLLQQQQQAQLEKDTMKTEMSEKEYSERNFQEEVKIQPKTKQVPQINLLDRQATQKPQVADSQKPVITTSQQRLRMDVNLTNNSTQKQKPVLQQQLISPKQSPKAVQEISNNLRSPQNQNTNINQFNLRNPQIHINDVEMKDESKQSIENKNKQINSIPFSKVNDFDNNTLNIGDQQHDFVQLEQQKNEIDKIVSSKFNQLKFEVNSMLNNFHIEIIRQFEVQRNQVDSILAEYLIENDPDESDEDDYIYLQVENKDRDDFEEEGFDDYLN